MDEGEGLYHDCQIVSAEMCPLLLTIEGGLEWRGSVTYNSGFALPPPLVASGTDQHNEAKPVNELLLRHEPCVCGGMCTCHTVDFRFSESTRFCGRSSSFQHEE